MLMRTKEEIMWEIVQIEQKIRKCKHYEMLLELENYEYQLDELNKELNEIHTKIIPRGHHPSSTAGS